MYSKAEQLRKRRGPGTLEKRIVRRSGLKPAGAIGTGGSYHYGHVDGPGDVYTDTIEAQRGTKTLGRRDIGLKKPRLTGEKPRQSTIIFDRRGGRTLVFAGRPEEFSHTGSAPGISHQRLDTVAKDTGLGRLPHLVALAERRDGTRKPRGKVVPASTLPQIKRRDPFP